MPSLSVAARAPARLPRPKFVDVVCWAIVLALAYALKRHYAFAQADELRWILAPTAWLVDLVSPGQFVFERHVGYVSTQALTAIVPSCAGVNFLIMAFGMLATGFVARIAPSSRKFAWILGCLVVAFVLTVVVNAARIRLGMWLRGFTLRFDRERIHLIEGVVVYLVMLTGTYAVANALFTPRGRS